MVIPLLETSYWLVKNIQYVIALIFGLSTILFSVAAWYIFRWFIPSPLSLIPFLRSTSKTKAARKTRSTRGKGDVKPTLGDRKPTTSITGLIVLECILALILCSIASSLVCAYSLTERGCYTLRHLGIIEWLPWKEGLKCYRTRWDWFADLIGEFMLTVLQSHEFGQSNLKSM
uniref:Uncharacterized protein n=1 Tax=Kwoniella bestiolae CBS 10118 TaxID=1296100 RepID=A0A1B9G1W0_9TREE|nr:hypothetical protein I302_04822 [Kwoniella bestiolae CBS 10118]OCF25012.1 hypothetical protein I302_04822 [Kwoniella bestiolae CBS 10118]